MSAAATQSSATAGAADERKVAKERRRLRRDLRFLRIYTLTVRRVLRYRPHPQTLAASAEPVAVIDRLEGALSREASRYRALGWCIFAVLFTPLALGAFLWSGMYWLPVRIYWWPFDRGNYGLPYLSLFEWLSYLVLLAYFVVAGAYLSASNDETRRLGTDYRRLLEAPEDVRGEIAAVIGDGAHQRIRYVVEHSPVFADLAAHLAEKGAQ